MIHRGTVREIFNLFNDDLALRTWTSTGHFYDPDKFNLVPKKEYLESAIKEKDQELSNLEHYYQNKKRQIEEEKSNLISQRSTLKLG